MSLLQLYFCSFLSFPFLPDITVLRLLHRLDVSRIVLAIRPGHHHLCAQDGPLGQSLAGRHGGVHPLANCHEDFMDVRFLLSLTEFARPVAFSSASVKSRRRRSDANDTHTLTVSHTHTAQCQCLRQRYVTEVQGTASTNRTKKCAANLSRLRTTERHGAAAAERAQCFTAPTAAAAARAALFLSLETPIRHFMRDLEPRGVAFGISGPPLRPRVRLRLSVGLPLRMRMRLQDVETKLRRGWTEGGLHSTDYDVHSPAAHGAAHYALALLGADGGAPAGKLHRAVRRLQLREAVRADVSKDNRSSADAADKAVASVMSEGQGQSITK